MTNSKSISPLDQATIYQQGVATQQQQIQSAAGGLASYGTSAVSGTIVGAITGYPYFQYPPPQKTIYNVSSKEWELQSLLADRDAHEFTTSFIIDCTDVSTKRASADKIVNEMPNGCAGVKWRVTLTEIK